MDGLRFCQLIHKYFYIPCMMGYIGSRTGITRVQNILHDISLFLPVTKKISCLALNNKQPS